MPVQNVNPVIERQARLLADDNRKAEPEISRVIWFPDEHEVRLIELTEQIPVSLEGEVHPFYFRESPQDNLPAPSAMAMIQPNEYGKLKLPAGWGEWSDGIDL